MPNLGPNRSCRQIIKLLRHHTQEDPNEACNQPGPGANLTPAEGITMAVGVDYSAWSVQDGEMKRRLDYTDSKTKQHVATIFFICKIEKGTTATTLSYRFAPFAVVDDLDLGVSLVPMSADRPMPVGVDVKSVDGGKGALMSPRTTQGIQRQLIALFTGQHLKFAVFQGPEQLVDMPFYNDDEFAIIYRQEIEKAGSGSKSEEKKKGWFGRW